MSSLVPALLRANKITRGGWPVVKQPLSLANVPVISENCRSYYWEVRGMADRRREQRLQAELRVKVTGVDAKLLEFFGVCDRHKRR